MYLVMQSFPEEKVLFASNSEKQAGTYFELQVQHGNGWFELKQEGRPVPLLAGGEQIYSPHKQKQYDKIQPAAQIDN